MQNSFVQQAGQWIAGIQPRQLSAERQERLQAMLLYNLAAALAGQMPADPLQQSLRRLYATPGPAQVFGTDDRLSVDDATAVHALLAIAAGFTDTHPGCAGHIGSMMIPAMLVLGCQSGATRDDVLAALWAGYDIPPVLGRDATHASTARGFRGTTVYGIFGVAAACSRILKLDAEQCAHALGIAANFASGLTQCFADGTAESQAQTVEAARAGLHAARLAAAGVKAAPRALEGEQGFYRAYAGHVPDKLDFSGWTLDELVIKPFPGCAVNHVPVLLLQRLIARHGIEDSQVEGITVYMNPDDATYPGVVSHGPFTGRMGAIMSAPFMLTVMLTQGALRLADFTERYAADPLHERSRCVDIQSEASLPSLSARLNVRLRNGELLQASSSGSTDLVLGLEAMRKLCPQILSSAQTAAARCASEALVNAVRCYFEGEISITSMMNALVIDS